MDEETKRREEIEARLEEERMLRQEQERRWQEEWMQERQRMEQALLAERQAAQQQMQTMFSYLQGLGATINYHAANDALASTTAATARPSFYLSSIWRYRHSCEYDI